MNETKMTCKGFSCEFNMPEALVGEDVHGLPPLCPPKDISRR